MADLALTLADAAAADAAPCAQAARSSACDWRRFESDDQRASWDRLAAQAAEPNPFHEAWYLLPALRAHDPESKVQLLVVEQDGEVLGLIPVRRHGRYYGRPIPNLATWLHGNAFLGAPLVARGSERLFWRAALGWIDDNAGPSLFLHLPQMPLSGPVHSALRDELAAQDRFYAVVHREDRALLASDLVAEAYFEASLSGKKRKELRRQAARLAELGTLRFDRQDDAEGLEAWIDAFLVLEHSGWKGAAGSALASHLATATLFREALRAAAAQGKLQRLALWLDDEPAAMLAQFLTPPGAFSFKTAFDERLARFSPGVLLQRENLALLDQPGIAWCDSCASADHPMIDHIWRERRPIGRLSIAIGGTLRRGIFRRFAQMELRRASRA